MMIITDSASDILQSEAEALDVRLVQLDIMLGGEHRVEAVEHLMRVPVEMLAERDDFPTTSQPSPDAYLALYEEARAADEDVLVICLSGALSGTVESARIAARASS